MESNPSSMSGSLSDRRKRREMIHVAGFWACCLCLGVWIHGAPSSARADEGSVGSQAWPSESQMLGLAAQMDAGDWDTFERQMEFVQTGILCDDRWAAITRPAITIGERIGMPPDQIAIIDRTELPRDLTIEPILSTEPKSYPNEAFGDFLAMSVALQIDMISGPTGSAVMTSLAFQSDGLHESFDLVIPILDLTTQQELDPGLLEPYSDTLNGLPAGLDQWWVAAAPGATTIPPPDFNCLGIVWKCPNGGFTGLSFCHDDADAEAIVAINQRYQDELKRAMDRLLHALIFQVLPVVLGCVLGSAAAAAIKRTPVTTPLGTQPAWQVRPSPLIEPGGAPVLMIEPVLLELFKTTTKLTVTGGWGLLVVAAACLAVLGIQLARIVEKYLKELDEADAERKRAMAKLKQDKCDLLESIEHGNLPMTECAPG